MITAAQTLDADQRAAVIAVLEAVEEADGVAAVGEEGLLGLWHPGHEQVVHLLAREDGDVVGYAWSDGRSAEIAVHPDARRRGHGRDLLGRLLENHPGAAVWAHGSLAPAVALAHAEGMVPARELLRMRAEVQSDGGQSASGQPDVGLPLGLVARPFAGAADGADGRSWLELNARVFATHPEQGHLDAEGLRRRMAEPWFEPDLFTLVEDAGRLVAYCWLKPGREELEVYVLGVDRAHRKRGIAAALVADALRRAARRGARGVLLFVEGNNAAALRSYERAGFHVDAVDTQFVLR